MGITSTFSMKLLHTSSKELGLVHIRHEYAMQCDRPTYLNMYDCELKLKRNLTDVWDWKYEANERLASFIEPERKVFTGNTYFDLKPTR